jgi:hypothetical protein
MSHGTVSLAGDGKIASLHQRLLKEAADLKTSSLLYRNLALSVPDTAARAALLARPEPVVST